jgi:hypothetical protein
MREVGRAIFTPDYDSCLVLRADETGQENIAGKLAVARRADPREL